MTVSRTRTEVSSSVVVRNNKPDRMSWLIFAITFILLHFGVSAFIVFRDLVLNRRGINGEGVFSFVFFILSGVLTSLECVLGYALVETLLSIGRVSSHRAQRLSAAVGGAVAYALIWVVLAFRIQVPKLYENVAGSILNF